MKKRFKSRKFQEGILVDIRLAERNDPISSKLISGILQLIMDQHLYPIARMSTTGGGMYIAFHSKENAKKIQKFVKEFMNENRL